MWLLGRLIPAMLGHFIPSNDENWQNFILLLSILELLLSPSITSDECAYLQILIEEHHETFVRIYPHASVIPKMHYMVHMARIMIW